MIGERKFVLALGQTFLAAGIWGAAAITADSAQTPSTPTPLSGADRSKELTLDCSNGVSMKLTLIPAGEFAMGGDESPKQVAKKCAAGVEAQAEWFKVQAKAEWFKDEQPEHKVKISNPFYMGVYDVTQAQYEAVTGTNPSCFKGAGNPVEQVSWNDAVEFCKKLSEKTGRQVRLPTEAEWEYACRAGTTTAFNTGETISTDQANYNGNFVYGNGANGEYRQKTTAVGSFPPNAWGLYDMHGNVWQWCQDWYGAYPVADVVEPTGSQDGQSRVLRGGSWYNVPWFCRSAYRGWFDPAVRYGIIGFRVVCAPRP